MLQLNCFAVLVFALSLPSLTWAECYSQRYSLVPPSKQPPYLHCGTEGRLGDPAFLTTLSAPHLEQCAQACKNATAYTTKTCISFGYSPSNSTCNLYGRRLIEQDFTDRGQNLGTNFYNKHCFACVPCPTGELVKNGGFQIEGPDGPSSALHWSLTGEASRYLESAGTDDYVVQLFGDGGSPTAKQTINCMYPGRPYLFSALFNGSFYVYLDQQKVPYREPSCNSTCGAFVRATATVISENPTPTLEFRVQGASGEAIIYADDVSLKLVT